MFSDRVIIWQGIWFSAHEVGFGVSDELHCRNVGDSQHQRLADPMYSVHDSATLVKDYRVGQISLENQRTVLNDASATGRNCPSVIPVTLVQLSHIRDQNLPNRKFSAQPDESANIPSQESDG